MSVCSSSTVTREEDDSILTVMSPKSVSSDGRFGDEDSPESAESDHDDIWR